MLRGQIVGIGGGPSCETWSAARLLPGGPRPVRSYDDPWGLPALTRSDHRQVMIGTALVQFLLDMLALAGKLGISLRYGGNWQPNLAYVDFWNIRLTPLG